LHKTISITHISSLSPLGSTTEQVWQAYLTGIPFFSEKHNVKVASVSKDVACELEILRKENHSYKNLDKSVLLALFTIIKGEVKKRLPSERVGVNIGSSRGATSLFEKYHQQFLSENKVSPFASPTTTTGNISSWVGQELGIDGIAIDQSVTCSTAMHALLNGIAWLQAEMADAFVVGGSEAALTPFTVAQMKALKLYSTSNDTSACESMNFQKKKNTMILGEGAAIAILERGVSVNTKAVIFGYGFASEKLAHNSSISSTAVCFQKSMKRALENASIETVDAIVMHAPGTVKGDLAEKKAIDIVFKNELPLLTSNKWLVGHTFAASGMLSIEMAVLMLQHNNFIENPFFENAIRLPKTLNTIMINAVGFGGNAVSIIISKP
jgi:3-oxoacyl-(acyl-carrier-protein) synthase